MKVIEEFDMLDDQGNGFNVRAYDTQELEVSYFEEWYCVDYRFLSLGAEIGEWEYFKRLGLKGDVDDKSN